MAAAAAVATRATTAATSAAAASAAIAATTAEWTQGAEQTKRTINEWPTAHTGDNNQRADHCSYVKALINVGDEQCEMAAAAETAAATATKYLQQQRQEHQAQYQQLFDILAHPSPVAAAATVCDCKPTDGGRATTQAPLLMLLPLLLVLQCCRCRRSGRCLLQLLCCCNIGCC